ncbi:hypothetical protein J7E21_12750 [Planococcus sp. ISL-109]|nr:hypothetical protein [Planococcus sp. ISL-109]
MEGLWRFGYQNGLADQDSSVFLHQIVERLKTQVPPGDGAALTLYQEAAAELSSHIGEPNDGALLGFQEDRDTHQAIQELPQRQRMLVVLHLVNGKSFPVAARILELDEQMAVELVETAHEKLLIKLALTDAQELTQRLEFLAKSYTRIKLPSLNMPAEPVAADVQKPPHKEQKVKKPVIWLVGASLALLAVMVGASFFIDTFRLPSDGQAQEGQLTTEMAEDMEQQYVDTREAAKQRLGLTEDEYSSFQYVSAADRQKETVFGTSNLKAQQDDAEAFQNQVKELLWMVETPKGMAGLVENSGNMLTAEVDRFLQLYIEKTGELQSFAQGILQDHQQQLAAQSEAYANPPLLLNDMSDAPEELSQLLTSWPEYGLNFRLANSDQLYLTTRNTNLLQRLPQFHAHSFANRYLQLLTNYPYFDEGGWLVEPHFLIESLHTMQYLLMDEPTDSVLKPDLEVMYEQTFWQIVKGAESEIYEDGQVKPEIRTLWRSLTLFDAAAVILLPVIEEMEDSNWRNSATLDALEYGTILEMHHLVRNGDLKATLPNGDFPLESEILDLTDFDYGRVEQLYARFADSHDRNLLAGMQPMDIYLLYFYANQQQDAETMWHLQSDSALKPSLEEYAANWEALPELTEKVLWVEITDQEQRIVEKVVLHPSLAYDGQTEYTHQTNPHQLKLVTEIDHIWLIQYEQREYVEGRNLALEQQGRDAYTQLKEGKKIPADTSPLVVVYALLHAVDEEDGEVVNQLLRISGEETDVDFWRNYASSHQVAGFENIESMAFSASDLNVQGTTVGNLQIRYETEAGEQWYEFLQMVETESGWRFEHFPNY